MPEQANQQNVAVMPREAAALAVARLVAMPHIELEEQTGRTWDLDPLPDYPRDGDESILPFDHRVRRYRSEPAGSGSGYIIETDRLTSEPESHPFTFSTCSITTFHYMPARGRYMWQTQDAYIRADENGYIDTFYDRKHPLLLWNLHQVASLRTAQEQGRRHLGRVLRELFPQGLDAPD